MDDNLPIVCGVCVIIGVLIGAFWIGFNTSSFLESGKITSIEGKTYNCVEVDNGHR